MVEDDEPLGLPEDLVTAITEGEWQDAAEILYLLSIEEAADLIASLDSSFDPAKESVGAKILEYVSPDRAANIFAGLDKSLALYILDAMRDLDHVVEILYAMGPQGAAEIFSVASGQWQEDPVSANFLSYLNGKDSQFANAVVSGLSDGRADYLRSIGGKF